MADTARLYYHDSYQREFDARIEEIRETGKGTAVLLDRTVFYPESGGQPADQGFLGETRVRDVQENEAGEILHLIEGIPPTDPVHGRLDWSRRFDHMQQHTGQHLLSEAFLQEARGKTLSFHLGRESSTIDLDLAGLDADTVRRVLIRAQTAIFQNLPVQASFYRPEEAATLPLRKPPARTGEIRIVEIKELDWSACGGTHLHSLGELGILLVTQVERYKGGSRVEFLCGWRALNHSLHQQQILGDLGRKLSAPDSEIMATVERLGEESRLAQLKIRELRSSLQSCQAKELRQSACHREGSLAVIQARVEVDSMEQLKFLAMEIIQKESCLVLLASRGPAGMVVAASSLPGLQDLGKPFQQTLSRYGGRGGGKGPVAQGGGFPPEQGESLLNDLCLTLTGKD